MTESLPLDENTLNEEKNLELENQNNESLEKEEDFNEDRSYLVGYVSATLLKGVLYKQNNAKTFAYLLKVERDVREYLATIGLALEIDDAEGYAYLRSYREEEYPDDMIHRPPKLSRTIALSFFTCFLLIMLRKRLIEFDSSSDSIKLVLSGAEILEYVKTFINEGTNSAKIDEKLVTSINQAVKLGFLWPLDKQQKEVRTCRYEVKRIIRAFFDAKNINSIDELLKQYLLKLNQDNTTTED